MSPQQIKKANELFTAYLAACRDEVYFPEGLTPLEYAAALRRHWDGCRHPGDLFIIAHGSDAEGKAVQQVIKQEVAA
jgi:hypothetical protein